LSTRAAIAVVVAAVLGCGGKGTPPTPVPSNQAAAPAEPAAPPVGVSGIIRFDPAVQPVIAPGSTIFVAVRGAETGGGLDMAAQVFAATKLPSTATPVAFHLTEAHSMMTATRVTGDVVVTARYDQDGDAITKQPGDITGKVHVTAPAAGLEIVLDDVLR
jgi:hypothetical protein